MGLRGSLWDSDIEYFSQLEAGGSGEAIFCNLHRDVHLLNRAVETSLRLRCFGKMCLYLLAPYQGEKVELVAGNIGFGVWYITATDASELRLRQTSALTAAVNVTFEHLYADMVSLMFSSYAKLIIEKLEFSLVADPQAPWQIRAPTVYKSNKSTAGKQKDFQKIILF